MNWKKLIGGIAPVLGGSLGGPFGAMAGTWLASELGVGEADLEAAVLSASPAKLLEIKGLEGKFKLEMAKLGLDEKKLYADDRNSARRMASETSLLPQMILAAIFVTGFITILYITFTGEMQMDASTKDMANYLLGILSAGLIQIMNFFFGSSAGSKAKTAKLS